MGGIAFGGGGASTSGPNAFVGAQTVRPVIADVAGNVTPDAASSNNFEYRLTGNLTLGNPSNPREGQVLNIRFKQDGVGGRTIVWPAKFKFAGGAVPALSAAAGAVDFLSAYYSLTDDRYECAIVQGVA
jgi:hypothetical protein